MAGNWVKLAPDITARPQFLLLCKATGLPEEVVLLKLYRLASWFHTHGDYGQMEIPSTRIINSFIGVDNFAQEMNKVGWLRVHGDTMTLFGFCDASAVRKSLGHKVRKQVLAAGKCAACGSRNDLVVDHIVPIVRGGSSRIENLQALCAPCNRSKGQKMPTEWRPSYGD